MNERKIVINAKKHGMGFESAAMLSLIHALVSFRVCGAADCFKDESRRTGVPYSHQTIMNLYLSECAVQGKRLTFAPPFS